jgi:hypothetical protein
MRVGVVAEVLVLEVPAERVVVVMEQEMEVPAVLVLQTPEEVRAAVAHQELRGLAATAALALSS